MDVSPSLMLESEVLYDLGLCWEPHDAQALVKNALFVEGKKLIFLECGRKWGKTDFILYCLYRYAMLNPNSACYYITPLLKQAKEIVWASNRLQTFFKPKTDRKTNLTHKGHTYEESQQIYVEMVEKYFEGDPHNTELRLRFKNGSFIKLDGADQYEAYRGVNPHLIVYDEFKDHHPKFHGAMDPNLATYDAPLICVGTGPTGDESNKDAFYEMAEYAKKAAHAAYFNHPTHMNPHISREFLARKKAELYEKGKDFEWLIEYMGKRVKIGSRSLFPMFKAPDPVEGETHTKHVRPHAELVEMVSKHHKSWEWFMAYDPASASTFGVLLLAIHKETKQILVMGEIYEQEKLKMSAQQIFPKSLELVREFPVILGDIRLIYDNAAAWFENEVAAHFYESHPEIGLEPCIKNNSRGESKKEDKISLIQDIMLSEDLFLVSDQCPKFIWELSEYRTDDKNKIPKENDHLIDDFRYILNNACYDSVPRPVKRKETDRRGYTMVEDRAAAMREIDPYYDLEDKQYGT